MKPSKQEWYADLRDEPFTIPTFTSAVRERVHLRLQSGTRGSFFQIAAKVGAVPILFALALVAGTVKVSINANPATGAKAPQSNPSATSATETSFEAGTIRIDGEIRELTAVFDGIPYVRLYEEGRPLATGERLVPMSKSANLPKNVYAVDQKDVRRAIIRNQDKIDLAEKEVSRYMTTDDHLEDAFIRNLNVSLTVPQMAMPVNSGKQITYTTRKESDNVQARFTINLIDVDGSNDKVLFERFPAPALLTTIRDHVYAFEYLDEKTHYITRIDTGTGASRRIASGCVLVGVSADESYLLVQKSTQAHFRPIENDPNKSYDLYSINLLTGEEKRVGASMLFLPPVQSYM